VGLNLTNLKKRNETEFEINYQAEIFIDMIEKKEGEKKIIKTGK